MVALAKKFGGFRCIAILPCFYRLFGALNPDRCQAWDAAGGLGGQVLDSAIPGSDAKYMIVARHLRSEVSTVLGRWCATILWDLAAFFDMIDLVALAEAVVKTSFPIDLFIIAGYMHTASRALRVDP